MTLGLLRMIHGRHDQSTACSLHTNSLEFIWDDNAAFSALLADNLWRNSNQESSAEKAINVRYLLIPKYQ
jgi:hypothetical protein